jgi:hypothetical protein
MMDDDEWGVVGGRISKGSAVFAENLLQCRLVHHKSHVT